MEASNRVLLLLLLARLDEDARNLCKGRLARRCDRQLLALLEDGSVLEDVAEMELVALRHVSSLHALHALLCCPPREVGLGFLLTRKPCQGAHRVPALARFAVERLENVVPESRPDGVLPAALVFGGRPSYSLHSKELVDKVYLPLARDLRRLADGRMTIRVRDHRFFDAEQLHLHCFLRRHVPIKPLALNEIPLLAKP